MDRFTSLDHRMESPAGQKLPTVPASATTTQIASEAPVNHSPGAIARPRSQTVPGAVDQTKEDDSFTVAHGAINPDRRNTPDSMPDLESVSSSESESEFIYKVIAPCTGCSGPQHRNIADCPAWILPAQVVVDNSPEGTHSATATGTTEVTPIIPQLHLGYTPVIDQLPYVPAAHVPGSQADTLVQNLPQLLGLDPTEPGNLSKMRDITYTAEMQARQAVEVFTRKLEEYESSAGGEGNRDSSTYVAVLPLSTLMTDAILTRRPTFELGLGQRVDDGGGKKEGKAIETATDQSLAAQHCGPRIGSQPRELMILDDESLPTPSISSLSWSPLPSDAISSNVSSFGSPISERSVLYDFDIYDPQQIIDDAVSRVLDNPPPKRIIYLSTNSDVSINEGTSLLLAPDTVSHTPSNHSSPDTSADPSSQSHTGDSDDDDTSSVNTAEFLEQVADATGYSPSFQNDNDTDNAMVAELYQWVEHQMERVDYTRRWDAGFGGQPWKAAKNTAYNGLHDLLDH
ncbi:hypothetical protein C8R44DRAFT_869243 [Mycena epipterygia]|nr:hypothetical protein C8R44DRAFT_869243 [Mycena epipterygia]